MWNTTRWLNTSFWGGDETLQELIQAIGDALGSGWLLLVVYGISLLLSFFLLKGKQKLFLLPAVIMTIAILNPLMKTLWEKINDYGYWRLLWIIPLIPVLAAVPAAVTEQAQKWYAKLAVILLAVGIIALSGSFIYSYEGTTFKKPDNPDKLPPEVTETADALLELDDTPRIVADQHIAIYIREYTGKIKTPFGRDLTFGKPSEYGRNIADYLNNLDMPKLIENMKAKDYKYLVTHNLDPERDKKIKEGGFEQRCQIREYGIYELK